MQQTQQMQPIQCSFAQSQEVTINWVSPILFQRWQNWHHVLFATIRILISHPPHYQVFYMLTFANSKKDAFCISSHNNTKLQKVFSKQYFGTIEVLPHRDDKNTDRSDRSLIKTPNPVACKIILEQLSLMVTSHHNYWSHHILPKRDKNSDNPPIPWPVVTDPGWLLCRDQLQQRCITGGVAVHTILTVCGWSLLIMSGW